MYSFSEKSQAYQQRLQAFMEQHIYPSETRHAQELHEASNRFATLPLTEALVPPGGWS